MDIINPNAAMVQSLHDACSFHLYKKTLDYDEINISKDSAYRKNFTNYYRVRRDAAWLDGFYEFFEANKNNKQITFEEVLRHLSNLEHKVKKTERVPTGKTKTVEASFASKMLATINPDHPIWDSQVLRFLDIEIDYTLSHEDKIEECIDVYYQIETEVTDFIQTKQGKECIALFDKTFPSCQDFSEYKKIDFYLWNLGK